MGDVRTLELPGLAVHVFTASEENYLVNSVIYELPDQLVVVDAQMFVPDAEDFAEVIERLGKPVTRFILSHNHPDHFSGFEVLCGRFPGVPLAALPGVTEYVATLGPAGDRGAARGDGLAGRVASRRAGHGAADRAGDDRRRAVPLRGLRRRRGGEPGRHPPA